VPDALYAQPMFLQITWVIWPAQEIGSYK